MYWRCTALLLASCVPPSAAKAPPADAAKIDPNDFFVFDPKDENNFSAPERREQIQWGRCSDEIYNELLRIRQLESASAAYAGTNCAIDAAIKEATSQRQKLHGAEEAKDWKLATERFARILYISQSFYANSNYVELVAANVGTPQAAPVIEIWNDAATRAALSALPGLHSGVDLNTAPKECPDGVPTRQQLSKARNGGAGGDEIREWAGWTKHDAAAYFSSAAGIALARELNHESGLLSNCEKLFVPAVLP